MFNFHSQIIVIFRSQIAFNETLNDPCRAEGILLQYNLIINDKRIGLHKNFAWLSNFGL